MTEMTFETLTLEERLALFDAEKHDGEVMQTTQQLGAEFNQIIQKDCTSS